MKKNLIIFLFTLFLGGITCFNYSYASTVVNVSESFCKQITSDSKTLDRNQVANQIATYDEATIDAYIQQKYNEMQKKCESSWCTYIESSNKCVACPWIRLNTNIPFIWNCIPTSTQTEVFPVFIGGLIQFTMSLLVLIWFICIIIGGIKISLWDTWWWRDLIMKVVYAMAALWASWVILKIINPNFFS